MEEIEWCEAELKNHNTSITFVYGGIPLKDYIAVHKIYLLKEMERYPECLALLKNIQSQNQKSGSCESPFGCRNGNFKQWSNHMNYDVAFDVVFECGRGSGYICLLNNKPVY